MDKQILLTRTHAVIRMMRCQRTGSLIHTAMNILNSSVLLKDGIEEGLLTNNEAETILKSIEGRTVEYFKRLFE